MPTMRTVRTRQHGEHHAPAPTMATLPPCGRAARRTPGRPPRVRRRSAGLGGAALGGAVGRGPGAGAGAGVSLRGRTVADPVGAGTAAGTLGTRSRLRRPHTHLPVAYRPRRRMQRITASGTSPSTGSPASSRPRSSVLETSTGATGHVDRPPARRGGSDRVPPGPAHHGQGHQLPQLRLVLPGGEVRRPRPIRPPDELGPRGSRCSWSDGVDGVRRTTAVDLDPARLEARPPSARRPPPWRSGPRPGSPGAPPPSARAGWPPPGACGRAPAPPARLGHLQVGGVDGVEGAAEDADAGGRAGHP